MPDIFKALATILAWGFFVVAWVMGLSTFVMGLITGALYGGQPMPMTFPASFAVALAYGVGAVVVMIPRKKDGITLLLSKLKGKKKYREHCCSLYLFRMTGGLS